MSRYKAYPEYFPSEVEFLDSLPVGWQTLRGKYVFSEYSERSEYGEEQLLSVSEYYGVKPRGEVVEEGDFLSRAESLVGYKKCQKNDLVMNIMLAWKCGLGVSKYDGIVSPAYSVFRFNGNAVPDYMHYLLRTETYTGHFKTRSTGVIDSRLRLYPESFGDVSIILPSAGEQKKIATFLDHETAKIDALIEKQQRLIELLKEKRQAVISHAVTKGLKLNAPMKDSGVEWLGEVPTHWDIWKLAHAFSEIGSGTTPRSDNFSFYENGEIPWLNTGDLNDGELDECEKKISNFALKEHSTLKLYPANSLAIAMYGATIAKVALLRFATTVNQACCVFGDSNIVSIKFLFYWILGFRAQIISLGTGGGQPNISQEILRNLRLACPNLAEQTDITNYLDIQASKFAELIKNAELFIQLLRERRTALISAAVTGKIDVRDWQAAA